MLNTLWITLTEIALNHTPPVYIPDHSIKGAYFHTSLTTVASFIINDYGAGIFIARYCPCRTNIQAKRIFTMLTTYGYKHIFLIHPECFISCLSQAKRFLFSKRAAQGTLFTSNAFFRIKQYYFFHKSYSIIFVLKQ